MSGYRMSHLPNAIDGCLSRLGLPAILLALIPVGHCAAVDFTRDVLPILEQRCFRCHEGRDASSGRRLDQRSEWLQSAGGGPPAIPRNAAGSKVIALVAARDPNSAMPPEGRRLSEAEIGVLREWIDAGLPWDFGRLPDDEPAGHWAFQPMRRPSVPLAAGATTFNTIDQFVAGKYRDLDLTPAPHADRRVLIRRLCFNLIGLPPTSDEVEGFLHDARPDAYERLVDRLLASPRYGERWGRHWLDVARWAESEGYESNHPRSSAWRYRDYVVGCFNQDKPFDEFIRQQIAGDELPEYSHENLIATGLLAAARISSNEEDKWRQRNDVNVDIVNAVGNALLGLTIQCAQCHDHKFDPLTARDYYQLQSFFVRGQPVVVRLRDSEAADEVSRELRQWNETYEAARRRLIVEESKGLASAEREALLKSPDQRNVDEELLARRADMQIPNSRSNIERYFASDGRRSFDDQKKRIDQLREELPRTFAFYSPVDSPHALDVIPSVGFYPLPYDEAVFAQTRPYIMLRGDVHSIGSPVEPDWPAFLRGEDVSIGASAGRRSRTDLANWLTDPAHPLVARVWVNRLWQYHFGRGLVATPDDFGTRGARPTHPQLLDWLATELIASGWSTRHIQRLIVTSQTFRLASSATPATRERDPENLYLTRWTPRRLEAEAIRDSWLAISGQLDLRVGGASVAEEDREQARRRSLYLFQRRGKPTNFSSLFDGPNECAASVGQRTVSTSPLQPLYLLNSEFVIRQARALEELVASASGGNIESAIDLAFRRTLQRLPTIDERVSALQLIETLQREHDHGDAAADGEGAPTAMTLFCQALLNLSELCYVD